MNFLSEWVPRSIPQRTRKARMYILDEVMLKAIAEPRKELSKYAPKIITMTIDPDKIKDVIGSGGKTINKIINDVFIFITLYFFILIFVVFLLSFDPINGQNITIVSDAGTYSVKHDLLSNFSAALSCISNIGPGFEALGPYSCFSVYNTFSKIVLIMTMLLGRLEILPVLILFNKRTWKIN